MGLFTNEEIFRVALEQSAIDSNCKWEDFLKKDNVIVTSVANPSARRYLNLYNQENIRALRKYKIFKFNLHNFSQP